MTMTGTRIRITRSQNVSSESESPESSCATAVSPSCGQMIVGKRKRNPTREGHSRWDIRFEELVAYKKQHGHCRVPQRIPILGKWVLHQRLQYKRLQSGKASWLSKDRLERLKFIGFVWDTHDDIWNMRFEQLKEYKVKHGNCMVPYRFAGNEQLGVVSNL